MEAPWVPTPGLPMGTAFYYSADNDGDEQPAYYLLSADGASETEALPAVENGDQLAVRFCVAALAGQGGAQGERLER